MTAKENELIKKAKRVLDEIGLEYEGHEIKISYDLDPIILEMDPERANDYLISVSVDRKTHKLKMVTTKYNMHEVRDELS